MSGFQTQRAVLENTVTSLFSKKATKPMTTKLKQKASSGRLSTETFVFLWNDPRIETIEAFINVANALNADPFTGSSAPGWVVTQAQSTGNSREAFKRCKSILKRAQGIRNGDGTGVPMPMRVLPYGGAYSNAVASNRMSNDDWAKLAAELSSTLAPDEVMPEK